ncbi:MAG: hypothetical protein Q4B60_09695 [Erysipelotrichaceae bacterium]|nr:hypothetical protein [Erysipelotrichaceae bacterium]
MMDKVSVVKWRYKVNKLDTSSSDSIDGYIDYIKDQVSERRNHEGRFEIEEGINSFNTEALLNEDSSNGDISKYISYMDERPGSHELFSRAGSNIEELVEEIRMHEGTLWIPIVSLKEEWAYEFGLDSEAKWIEKARELAEVYRKELNINSDNYGWVAAFHTKPEVSQNENSDAGCQPHLHFILYEKNPDPHKSPTIRHKKLDEIRSKTASILSREYMSKSYEERNSLRKEIKDKATDLKDVVDDVHTLLWDIEALTHGKGKLSVGEFEHSRDVTDSLISALSLRKPLSNEQQFYKRQLDIETSDDAIRAFTLYVSILDRLETITDKLLSTDDAKALVDEWKEVSNSMRTAQGFELSKKQTDKDMDMLKREISNSILKEAKQLSSKSRFITKKFKGMLLERMEFGSFKQNIKIHDLIDSTRVISSLLKECGVSKDDAKKELKKLLETTEDERKRKLAMAEFEREYKKLEMGMTVSTTDFWNAMKCIGINVYESSIYDSVINDHSLANSILLEPITKDSLKALDTGMDIYKVEGPVSILTESLSSLTHIPLTKEEYEAKYLSLLESYESYNQDIQNERKMLDEEEIEY